MSTAAAGQDILSILKMFTSPRMGPFESTNAPAPQPPPESVANAAPGAFTSGNEQQSALPTPDAGPPQPVARRVVPDGGDPNAPAPGATPAALKLPAPGTGAPGPGLATQPPPGPGTGTMPDFVSNNVVWQAWEAQRRRLYEEAQERQKIDLSASGFGDIARAFGGTVTGGVGGAGGGGITSPGSSAATGQSSLSLEQFALFKKAQDDAVAERADLQRIDRIVADPRMKGVTKDALLTLRANDKDKFAGLIKDYFNGETVTHTDSDGNVWSRPKFGEGTPQKIIDDPSKAQANLLDRIVKGQEVINPALQSDDVLKQIARATNQPHPDDPRTLAMLRSMAPKELQDMVKTTATAAAGVSQPREWEGKEIEEKRQARTKINESVSALPRLEYLVSKIDDGMRTGSWTADRWNDVNRNLGAFIGVEQGTKNADDYNAAVQQEVQKVIKQYGSNASNSDRIAAEASLGAGTSPETARTQLGYVAKSKIWEVTKHNADIQSRLDRGIMTDQNGRSLEAQKADYPKPTESVLHTMNIDPEAVTALKSSPTPAVKAAFRDRYGDTIAEWILGEAK